jgi:excisionase family DNA binding protein
LAYSIPEAVAATGIGRSSLYTQIKDGHLRSTKIGGRTVIMAEHLTAWLRSFVGEAA